MRIFLLLPMLILALLLASCASAQKRFYAGERPPPVPASAARPETGIQKHYPPKADTTPNRYIPAAPEHILGMGKTDSKSLAQFLLRINPFVEQKFAEEFASIYIEEAAIEGVNHDVAFSQMCLETGFLSFGGLVKPEMNNYCGLGSLGPEAIGESFPSPRIGVRAQIQHLKAYATDAPLKQPNVDPRRKYVRQGSAATIYQLAGSWAEDREYGNKLKGILDRLYAASFGY